MEVGRAMTAWVLSRLRIVVLQQEGGFEDDWVVVVIASGLMPGKVAKLVAGSTSSTRDDHHSCTWPDLLHSLEKRKNEDRRHSHLDGGVRYLGHPL